MPQFSLRTLIALTTATAATLALANYAANSEQLWLVAVTIGTFIVGNLVLGLIRKGANRAFHFGCFLFAFGTFFSPPYSSFLTFQSTLSRIYLNFPHQIYL